MENISMLALMPVKTSTTSVLISLAHITALEQIASKTSLIYLDDGRKFEVPYTLTELAKIADESLTDFIRDSMKATKAILEEEDN